MTATAYDEGREEGVRSAPSIMAADGPSGWHASGSNDVSASAPVSLPHAFGAPVSLTRRVLTVTQTQNYRYTDAVRNIVTRLCLIPPTRRGGQRLLSYDLRAVPLPHGRPEYDDLFGNHIIEVHQEQVREHLTLVLTLRVENVGAYDAAGQLVPTALPDRLTPLPESVGGAGAFLSGTWLTEPDDALRSVLKAARGELADPAADPFGFAAGLCRFVYREMRYVSGSTGVSTTAAQAWEARTGVCQDFAHVYLVLSRLAGVPARYVSGFLPGEGAMHAWVETLLPGGESGSGDARPCWVALDPTHERWVDERYISIAVGRDYSDIVPNSGTYYGRGQNTLRHRSQVKIETTITEALPGTG